MAFTYQYVSGNTSNLDLAINHLIQLQDPTKIIESQSGYEAIFQIAKYIAYQTSSITYEIFTDKNMHEIYGNVLYRLYEIHSTYDFGKDKISATDPTSNANYNEKCITIFCMVTYSCNLIMSNLLRFKLLFQKTKGLEAIMKMLNDENFLSKNLNLSMNPFNSAVLFIIDYLTLNLSSISISCQEFKDIWNDLDSVNVLLRVAKRRNTAKEYCYNTVLNVANDKQLETLTEIQNYSKDLEKKVQTIANDFRNNRYDRQKRQILNENGVTKVDIHCLKDSNNIYTSYIVVFNGLYNLSVNDKLKIQIYFASKDDYKVIINKGNDWERHYCLKLMSQLSLSENIAHDLRLDSEFLGILDAMIGTNNALYKKFCEQIKWNLKEKPKEEEIIQQKQQQQVTQQSSEPAEKINSHIMISYNTASRELCLQIKERLESLGYKIWIDVNDIHGSSLDSMARAVEDSFCVLMCVTEKYRQSVNCQAEAQYAFRINKPIIPLIMQKGYENVSGWLGIIMGDKIFVNFMKYSFDECIKRLKNEIESKLASVRQQNSTNNPSGSVPNGKKNPESMTQDEVKQWLTRNAIDSIIVNYLNSCDGLVLKQLFDMKHSNPQFYDQSLSKLENINMMSILKFNAAIDALFD